MSDNDNQTLPVEMSGYIVMYQEGDLSQIAGKGEYSIEIKPMFLFSKSQAPVGIMLHIQYQIDDITDVYKYVALASYLFKDKTEAFNDEYSKESLSTNPIVKEMLQAAIGYARADLQQKATTGNIPYLPLIPVDSIIQNLIVREE